MSKPTILIVYEMLGGEANGAMIYSRMLKTSLQQQGYHVPFISAHYPEYPPEAGEIIELPSQRIPPWSANRFVRYFPPISHRLITNIADQLPNLSAVICNGPYKSGLIAAQIADHVSHKNGCVIPKVMIQHTQQRMYTDTWHIPRFGKEWWMRRVIAISRLYDLNIALSRSLQQILDVDDIQSIHLPIGVIPVPEPVETKEELRQKMGYLKEHLIYLYVGRLTVEKNIETLLRAFAIVAKENCRAVLILVGGGKIARYQSLAQKLGIDWRRIYFVGRVDRKDIGRYYKMADVFVTASLTANSPIVIIEALQFGLPIVAFAAGGIPEICGEANFLLVPGHFAKGIGAHVPLASFMMLVEETENRQRLQEESYQRYQTAGYDMAIHLPKLLTKIEEIRSAVP